MVENDDDNGIEDSSLITSTFKDDADCDTALEHFNSKNDGNVGSTSVFLYFCATIACMVSSVKFGFIIVWISPVSKQLVSDDPNVNPIGEPVSTVHLASMSVIPGFLSTIGALFLGRMCDIYGRKKAMIIMSLPVIFLDICIAFASDILMIYIPIIINSFLLGGLIVGGRVYLTEISENHNRSKIVCIGGIGIPLGNVCSFLIGSCNFSYKIYNLASSIPFIVSVGCLVVFLTDSPVSLIARNKQKEALGTLRKLRGLGSGELQKELEVISYTLEKTSLNDNISFTSIFTDKTLRRAFFLSFVIHVVAFSGGASSMMTHLRRIIDESGSSIPSYISVNLLTVTQLFSTFMASQISEKFGRKTLLYASLSCNTVSLFSIALYFYLKSMGFAYIENISWWPILGLTIFYTSNSLGVGSVCWVFTSESFPNNALSMAISLLGSIDALVASSTVFAFPLIADAYGIKWNLFFYGMVNLLGYIFVYLNVPETRGKSLIEIQATLRE